MRRARPGQDCRSWPRPTSGRSLLAVALSLCSQFADNIGVDGELTGDRQTGNQAAVVRGVVQLFREASGLRLSHAESTGSVVPGVRTHRVCPRSLRQGTPLTSTEACDE